MGVVDEIKKRMTENIVLKLPWIYLIYLHVCHFTFLHFETMLKKNDLLLLFCFVFFTFSLILHYHVQKAFQILISFQQWSIKYILIMYILYDI